ncbi:hypothetical protein [Ancylomarina sp. 16SWW S1-10-2]|uniref:hypothetical protein n=1 Tax=Ancylomarina sp. 16SWW S1-10-2 TaxID=2499681 RepID=UPI0012AE8029|nr:hypothetical protein [Ancylomarina sp. 16SWW S1-10-2]MRT91908.1 hypothetical protein [Ancylomarina sp. 16SWW S1-10-2]
MAKKDFKKGIDGLLQSSISEKKEPNKETKALDLGSIKATYYLNIQLLNQIKAIAFYERKTIGSVINEALKKYASKYKNMDEALKLFK